MGCRVKVLADGRSLSTRLALKRIVPKGALHVPIASGGARAAKQEPNHALEGPSSFRACLTVDDENSNTSTLSERDLHDQELLVGLLSFAALDPATCGEAFL